MVLKEDHLAQVIFDTLDLNIEKIEVDGVAVSFHLTERHPIMGSALQIPLPTGAKSGAQMSVKIFYKTSERCIALQWLEKEQTQGGQFPYLFSQCQPIYARALAPLQDTPSIKMTYSAQVASVLPVLLSAIRVSPPSDGPAHDGKVVGKDTVTYTYDQPVPIPSYLIAIASGNLCYRSFPAVEGKSWTSGVWAEPELMDSSYWEFTLLTGDRSLVDVVVHELTHSWFGNGITHAYATHFWLNEGWTTYIERLLQQFLHSSAERGFSFLIGSKALQNALNLYKDKPKYQRLVIDFEPGEDPDEAYSTVPYEKGANFLLHIEQKLGGLDVFLPYVKDYVKTFMGKSITTDQWKAHLFTYYEKNGSKAQTEALNEIDWKAWLYGDGVELPVKMEYDMSLATPPYNLAQRWDASRSMSEAEKLPFAESDVQDFNANQKVVFLERLSSFVPLPSSHISHLGSLYRVSTSTNAEIRMRFYDIALQDPLSPAAKLFAKDALRWVVASKVDPALAKEYFARSKDAFHPIARKIIEKDLASK
ncbi:hypothetical protein EWM64_g6259 [Hericium alpestre]|uniref:Peptidase M1 leukotriene A4 hydrolase/aminopeptidase C-terminal domain-containing protein n=1 Tax=Hericium alpestre TaxID=135208 RepID=A0A4Y9ZUP8_9AGAM|nr:hypothetical protein EWM64_g6259 [Hericium alpestre]